MSRLPVSFDTDRHEPALRAAAGRASQAVTCRAALEMTGRAGYALTELVVAVVLGAVVSGAALAMLTASARLTGAQLQRAAWEEARRMAHVVLEDELRYADPVADVALGRDTLALRAFRGAGVACRTLADGAIVRYVGLRYPEADKDSVLVLDAGGPMAHDVMASRPVNVGPGCEAGAGESLRELRAEAPIPAGAIVLVFEAGSYHLAERALRYRRGLSGRQPLTEEVFHARPGSFSGAHESGTLEVELRAPEPAAGPPGTRFRVGMLNRTVEAAGQGGGR